MTKLGTQISFYLNLEILVFLKLFYCLTLQQVIYVLLFDLLNLFVYVLG
jgi:hypothetical protein